MSSTAGTSEYDRFGPWIDEVLSPGDLPRLYRDHPVDFGAAQLVLKVPRNIDRRDATAEMDLYDHVLVAGRDDLTVLSRRAAPARDRREAAVPGGLPGGLPRGYDIAIVPFGHIVAIRDVADLLNGRLTMWLVDGSTLQVPYNGAARDAVGRLVAVLRDATTTMPASPVGESLRKAALTMPTPTLAPGKDDLALLSELRDLQRQNPAVVAWTCHGRIPVHPRRGGLTGVLRRASHAISPMTLHGSILAADEAALEVLGRHDWLVRGRAPIHSVSRFILPWSAPDGLRLAPHPRYPDATVATIFAGGFSVELVLPNDCAARSVLSAATGWLTADA